MGCALVGCSASAVQNTVLAPFILNDWDACHRCVALFNFTCICHPPPPPPPRMENARTHAHTHTHKQTNTHSHTNRPIPCIVVSSLVYDVLAFPALLPRMNGGESRRKAHRMDSYPDISRMVSLAHMLASIVRRLCMDCATGYPSEQCDVVRVLPGKADQQHSRLLLASCAATTPVYPALHSTSICNSYYRDRDRSIYTYIPLYSVPYKDLSIYRLLRRVPVLTGYYVGYLP